MHRFGARRARARAWCALALTAVVAGPAQAQSRQLLYVENTISGDVTVVEIPSHKVVSTIPASKVGNHPDDVIASKQGDVIYVNRHDTRDVIAISTATEEVLWRAPVGGRPDHLAVSHDGREVYVPLFDEGELEIIDTAKKAVVAKIDIGYGPHSTKVSANGRLLYVGHLLSDQVMVIDLATRKVVKTVAVPEGVRPFAISPDDKRLYAQLSKLHGFVVVDLETGHLVQTVHLPSLGVPLPMGWPQTVNHGLALTADGRLLLAAGSMKDFVAIYQVSDMSLLATIPVGKDPNWIVFSPDERFAYVSNRGEHTVSVISMADRKEIARLKAGKLPMRMTTATVPSPRTSSR
jgi:YVTN family beta-propeller protein